MVQHKRTQSRWAVKAPAETNNSYDSELKKPILRRSYSEETDLSEAGKQSGHSSGDESWSDSSVQGAKTKLSGEAGLFVPQQATQSSAEQRTRLWSGASVFVPGQMPSQQMTPTFAPDQMTIGQQMPVMFMPQMMPMEAQCMPYMAPCYYMAPDGCYYMATDGMCPATMPVISGAAPCVEAAKQPPVAVFKKEPAKETVKPSTIKDPKFTGSPASSPKSRWADLDDDDEAEDPWLQ